jgi:Protein of unknown function (DUF1524)
MHWNLVIFQAKKNSIIGNSSFTEKRKLPKESPYLLTADIGNQNTWGFIEINSRQEELPKLAVETWPIKI